MAKRVEKKPDLPVLDVSNKLAKRTNDVVVEAIGRKNRDEAVVFGLIRLASVLEPIDEAFGKGREVISEDLAQRNPDGSIRYRKDAEGFDTATFPIEPRRAQEHRERQRKLAERINHIVGLQPISLRALLDGWKTEDDDEWGGVEPVLILSLAPFLKIDVPEAEDLLGSKVVVTQRDVEELEVG